MKIQNFQKLKEELIAIGILLEEGNNFEDLRLLRKIVSDLDIVGIASSDEGKKYIFQIYFLKKFLNEIYLNLGTDSFFSFPNSKESWASKSFTSIAHNLGKFITTSFITLQHTDANIETCHYFRIAIDDFYQILAILNSHLDEVTTIDDLFSRQDINK